MTRSFIPQARQSLDNADIQCAPGLSQLGKRDRFPRDDARSGRGEDSETRRRAAFSTARVATSMSLNPSSRLSARRTQRPSAIARTRACGTALPESPKT